MLYVDDDAGDPIVLIGFDPAQRQDYAGVTVVEVVSGSHGHDQFGYPHAKLIVRWLDRWRGENYETMVDKLEAMVNEYDANMLVIDDTGVGSAVGDMLANRHLGQDTLMRILFTGGDTQPNREPTPRKHTHHVSKSRIIAALVTLFESNKIKGGRGLPLLTTLKNELKGYRVKLTLSANETYINEDSEHDDLLCALALPALVVQRLWGLRYLPDLSKRIEAEEEAVDEADIDGSAADQQKAADLKRKARDAACWGDDDVIFVEE
jgi:Terminase RNaseH-like domain